MVVDDILDLFQEMNAPQKHVNQPTVLTSCKEIRQLKVECILYTPLGKASPFFFVIWTPIVQVGW